ncbi:hypothetical protein GCM10010442_77840 [Kitasatospora kifunensis]
MDVIALAVELAQLRVRAGAHLARDLLAPLEHDEIPSRARITARLRAPAARRVRGAG